MVEMIHILTEKIHDILKEMEKRMKGRALKMSLEVARAFEDGGKLIRFSLSKTREFVGIVMSLSKSIQFLQNNGIDFDKLRKDGIDFDMFAQLLSGVVAKHRNLCWVTFQGLAYFFQGLRGGELGLATITKILNVERVGWAHQAGFDSLLTVCVYTKMRMLYKIDETNMWCLYGVSARICKPIFVPNINGRCFIPYFSTQALFQHCIPPHCCGFMQAAPTFSHVL
ncbi:hypothetical protein POTOM_055850 [Populus tomentosa]|uniref:Uncharacterized protein n=1 Tax=Populus tomentosa TaxID=118781 RepID=A0A8X7XXL6_POPTO|nr:hypothetical protein POTOM_055850 [Populus tomentosa]